MSGKQTQHALGQRTTGLLDSQGGFRLRHIWDSLCQVQTAAFAQPAARYFVMPNATLRSRLLSSQTSGNKAVGYFLARDIELSCSRAGRKSLSRKGLPAKPGFCFSPSSDRMSCGNVVGNVRETKPRSGSDYVGIAELASMQAYWGVFCAFADPLGEVMGAYLSAPVTEKVRLGPQS